MSENHTSADPMEPLDSELQSLVEVERQRPEMPLAAQERLLRRVGLSISIANGPRDGSDPAGGAPSAPRSGLRRLFRRRLPVGIAAFALGGLTAAGVITAIDHGKKPEMAALAPSPPAAPTSNASSVRTPPVAPAIPTPAIPTKDEPPRPRASNKATANASADEHDSDLEAERALVELARSAIARRDPQTALDTLARDARQFPRGQLVEEQQSLRVQALVQLGRYAEARRAAALFFKQFPSSMLSPVVSAALEAIP